jgi:hypothetical protein
MIWEPRSLTSYHDAEFVHSLHFPLKSCETVTLQIVVVATLVRGGTTIQRTISFTLTATRIRESPRYSTILPVNHSACHDCGPDLD